MGRFFLYPVMALLAVFVLFTWLVVDRGVGSPGVPPEVAVRELLASPTHYLGQRVSTEGVLERRPGPGERFVIVADEMPLELRGYEKRLLRRFLGRGVSVIGTVRLDRRAGLYIEAEVVTPLR